MRFRLTLSLALFLAVAPTHEVRADNVDLAEKLVQMIEQVATVVSRNIGSCDAMGDALEQYVVANAEFLQQAKAAWRQIPVSEQRALKARFQPRITAALSKINPGMAKCYDHPKVSNAVRAAQTM